MVKNKLIERSQREALAWLVLVVKVLYGWEGGGGGEGGRAEQGVSGADFIAHEVAWSSPIHAVRVWIFL
jgi:hypothetical protein